jgi:hypothetical protein
VADLLTICRELFPAGILIKAKTTRHETSTQEEAKTKFSTHHYDWNLEQPLKLLQSRMQHHKARYQLAAWAEDRLASLKASEEEDRLASLKASEEEEDRLASLKASESLAGEAIP